MLSFGIGISMPNFLGIAFFKYKKADSYKVGDIVLFRGNNKRQYFHRIVSINESVFTTKGDNYKTSNSYETDVPIANIFGRVYWSFPSASQKLNTAGGHQ
jgi:hypothetical protein